MIIALSADIREDLREFERRYGVPVSEQVHEAILVWSRLETVAERRILARVTLRLVRARRRPTLQEIAEEKL